MNGKEDTSEETDRIIADASANIKKDRERLIDLIETVRSNIDRMSASGSAVSEESDSSEESNSEIPVVGLHDFLESLTRATDSLTKSNAQLVELAKLSARRGSQKDDSTTLGEKDKQTLYDDMEDHGTN